MTIDRTTDVAHEDWAFRPPRGFLRGRTALVTGGARRIGRTLALALASEGAAVVVHFLSSRQGAEETAAAITEHGGCCHLVQGDLADAAVVATLVAQAAKTAGADIDILINNAAIFGPAEALDIEHTEWDRYHAVNVRAPYLLARDMARHLPAGWPGDIVNLNDVRALRPGSDHLPYTISKVGLHGLTRSLALALAPAIRVNELMLGAILPPENGGPAGYEHVSVDMIPTRRFDSPREVAAAMLFLLSNPAVTGQSLCVDGGRHLL